LARRQRLSERQPLEDERAALAHLRIEALELGAGSARELEPALAETLARDAVAAAPFRESAWVELIAALRARGAVAPGRGGMGHRP
jgi:hypothetical protein